MAVAAVVNVVTVVPSPGAAKDDLAKAAVTPGGKPDHASVTAELKIPLCVLVALKVAVVPCPSVSAL